MKLAANLGLSAAVLATLVLGSGCPPSSNETKAPPPPATSAPKPTEQPAPQDDAPRGPAPEIEAQDLSGKAIKLSDFRGKVVLLDIFATWCPPCRREIPGFIDIQTKYAGRVVVLGITGEAAKVVQPFIEKEKINYTVAIMDMDKLPKAYDGEQIPRTFVIDGQGNFVAQHADFAEESFFVEKIEAALKTK
jgi:peroxiredoxin